MKISFFLLLILSSCSFKEDLKERVHGQNQIEGAALSLAKENRELRGRVVELEAEFKKGTSSVQRTMAQNNSNLQEIDEKWRADEILFVAEIEYEREDYEKSSYFFQNLFKKFPNDKIIDDQVLFKAGRSFYQDGKNFNLALQSFDKIPTTSIFHLQSKLWTILVQKKLGNKKQFHDGLKEFEEKYQNTPEWKILERHYEKIIRK